MGVTPIDLDMFEDPDDSFYCPHCLGPMSSHTKAEAREHQEAMKQE